MAKKCIYNYINSHWSLVIGRWSLVVGHWSLVIGHQALMTKQDNKQAPAIGG